MPVVLSPMSTVKYPLYEANKQFRFFILGLYEQELNHPYLLRWLFTTDLVHVFARILSRGPPQYRTDELREPVHIEIYELQHGFKLPPVTGYRLLTSTCAAVFGIAKAYFAYQDISPPATALESWSYATVVASVSAIKLIIYFSDYLLGCVFLVCMRTTRSTLCHTCSSRTTQYPFIPVCPFHFISTLFTTHFSSSSINNHIHGWVNLIVDAGQMVAADCIWPVLITLVHF